MTPDMENPTWKRPDDWPYEEDWNSPAWKQRNAILSGTFPHI